jgi:hypothetical protein
MQSNRFGLCATVLGALFLVPAANADDILFYNHKTKKQEHARGRIVRESPSEITYVISTRTEKVPADDVLEVTYDLGAALRIDLGKVFGQERRANELEDVKKRVAALDDVVAGFRGFLPKLDDNKLAQRNLEFIIANVLVRQAEDDSSRLGAAIDALKEFMTKHEKSWQIAQAGKTLARLQTAKGDVKGARATYEELGKIEDLAPEVRQQCDMLAVKVLINAGSLDDAQKKLNDLAKALPKNDPQLVRVEIYQAACQAKSDLANAEKRLKAVLAGDADGKVKALAFNTLGDCYRLNDRAGDAFWQYLWVDVQYSQDLEEHAKALYYLSILFESIKQKPDRAQACRERLLTDKLFAGSEYQRKAAKESQK